jgi:CheY-like chemotaxis protein
MGSNVLCVDANRDLCQVIAKALTSAGYEVQTESDGAAAFERIRKEEPDLVLLDLILPGRDGFSVLEGIRQLSGSVSKTPVVLLSGCSPTPEYNRRARALDAIGLLTKPVPLTELVDVVAGQLGEAKTQVPARQGARSARKQVKDRTLTGDLERFSFPALIHHLHGLQASGVVALQAGRKRKWVQVRDGYPTAVRSNLVNECLGNFLARSGRITSSEMEESVRRMKAGQLQGEILVAMDIMSEEEISHALREQAEQKFYEIFAWPKGQFRFEFGASLQKASGMAHRSPANLILHGVLTRSPLDRVDALLQRQPDAVVVRGKEPFYRFQEVALDEVHRDWVERMDSHVPVREFYDADSEKRRVLFALITTGILELAEGDAVPTRTTVAAPRVERRAPAPAPPADPVSEVHDEQRRAELAQMADRFSRQSLFEILGVDDRATDEEIESAYEALAERTHPDHLSNASEAVRRLSVAVFRHVEQAYETLQDPKRRQLYVLDLRRSEREAAEREEQNRSFEALREFQRGEQALEQRAYEDALLAFGRALERCPDEGEYHAHYGWALHLCHPDDAQMVEEAIEHVRRGLKLASDREKPYLLMGRLCKATGRTEAAERMFTRAVQVQPECVEALRELRLINMRREKQKGFVSRLLRR